MTTGRKLCVKCGKTALSFVCGPRFAGQDSPTGDGRFYFCAKDLDLEYRKLRDERK